MCSAAPPTWGGKEKSGKPFRRVMGLSEHPLLRNKQTLASDQRYVSFNFSERPERQGRSRRAAARLLLCFTVIHCECIEFFLYDARETRPPAINSVYDAYLAASPAVFVNSLGRGTRRADNWRCAIKIRRSPGKILHGGVGTAVSDSAALRRANLRERNIIMI